MLAPAIALAFALAPAKMPESFTERVAREVNASRKCNTQEGSAVVECSYSFKGIDLVLVLDPREPQTNAFLVRGAPSRGSKTFLKFGGLHSCAMITHGGTHPGELAFVFISPKTGDVWTEWDGPQCAK